MHCSSCGGVVGQDLIFCNLCGARLKGVKGDDVAGSAEVKPELLVSAIVGLFIFGLVAIAVLIGVLKQIAGFDFPILLAITTFSFVLMMLVESVLVWMLLRGKRGAAREANVRERSDTAQLKELTTRELDGRQPPPALTEPVPSVVEHTTRNFEPIYRDKK